MNRAADSLRLPRKIKAAYFPGITPAGAAMLHRLLDSPNAPIFRNQSGHRLLPGELLELQGYIDENQIKPILSPYTDQGMLPEYVHDLLRLCRRELAFFHDETECNFAGLPTTSRSDLSRDMTRFVPHNLPLDRLICFSTSGTTGHPLTIPSHPIVAARYQAFHRRALAHFGIVPQAGAGDVAVALIGAQQRCFTYASVNPLQDEAGLVKLNLNVDDWRDPADRVAYLDELAPELMTGDPISLTMLATLTLKHKPRAILSTSMQMLAGVREKLQTRFSCPVLDIYSMNEAGPIAVFDEALGGHVLLQPQLWVEIVDDTGRQLPEGEVGEITLTGGFNPWLPLRRYRTGDFAAIEVRQGLPVLMGLIGRPPVRFYSSDGRWINNVDISQALQPFEITQFTLHQAADGALTLCCDGEIDDDAVRQRVAQQLGAWPLTIKQRMHWDNKVIQYSSDFV